MLWAQRSKRDLGVVMQCDLKVDMQCGRAANEANNKFGVIKSKVKLFRKRYRLDVGKFKFASRVCEEWNRLGDGIVSDPGKSR